MRMSNSGSVGRGKRNYKESKFWGWFAGVSLVMVVFMVLFLFFVNVAETHAANLNEENIKIETDFKKIRVDSTIYESIEPFSRDSFVHVVNLKDKGFIFLPHEWKVLNNPFVWKCGKDKNIGGLHIIFEPMLLIQSSLFNYTQERKDILHSITSKSIKNIIEEIDGIFIEAAPVRMFNFDGLKAIVVEASYTATDGINRTIFNCIVPNGEDSFSIIVDLPTEITANQYVEGIFSSIYVNGITW